MIFNNRMGYNKYFDFNGWLWGAVIVKIGKWVIASENLKLKQSGKKNKATKLLMIIFILLNGLSPVMGDDNCFKIKKEIDGFTGEINYSTPKLLNFFARDAGARFCHLYMYKYISPNSTVRYYLHLKTAGSTLNVNTIGIYIIFSDKTKIKISEEIELVKI